MRSGFKYTVKYVKKNATQKGTVTKFSVGEKMHGTDSYVNWQIVVFSDLDIADGDRVLIDAIESIDQRVYNDKTYIDIVCKVHKISDEQQGTAQTNTGSLPFDI